MNKLPVEIVQLIAAYTRSIHDIINLSSCNQHLAKCLRQTSFIRTFHELNQHLITIEHSIQVYPPLGQADQIWFGYLPYPTNLNTKKKKKEGQCEAFMILWRRSVFRNAFMSDSNWWNRTVMSSTSTTTNRPNDSVESEQLIMYKFSVQSGLNCEDGMLSVSRDVYSDRDDLLKFGRRLFHFQPSANDSISSEFESLIPSTSTATSSCNPIEGTTEDGTRSSQKLNEMLQSMVVQRYIEKNYRSTFYLNTWDEWHCFHFGNITTGMHLKITIKSTQDSQQDTTTYPAGDEQITTDHYNWWNIVDSSKSETTTTRKGRRRRAGRDDYSLIIDGLKLTERELWQLRNWPPTTLHQEKEEEKGLNT
jgi:hypothetical protein